MSLLDSDAEELKARGSPTVSSGRKANQSGLGALKSLSKYSNLTAKYRVTQTEKPSQEPIPKPLSVEHSRGTILDEPKSVQSQCINEPTKVLNTEELLSNHDMDVSADRHPLESFKVSAESPQSQCKDEPASSSLEASLSEVSAPEVSAKPKLSDDLSLDKREIEEAFIQTIFSEDYSNQFKGGYSQCKVSASDILSGSTDLKTDQENGLQSQCNLAPTLSNAVLTIDDESAHEVSANKHPLDGDLIYPKSVQSQCNPAPSSVIETNILPKQDNALVGANLHGLKKDIDDSGHILEADSADENKITLKSYVTKTKVSAKSVQAGTEVRAKVGAISVQSEGKVSAVVSAKIKTLEDEFLLPNESALTVTGAQKSILDFIYDQCVWNQGLVTGPITKVQLIEATKLNEDTALSAIKRLRKKKMIDRHSYKDGKAGWTQYRIAELSYKEILTFRQNYQSSYLLAHQSQGKVSAVVSANPSSKLDSNINNISNYTSAPTYQSTWFKSLNFTPVFPINPMQVNSSIRKLVEERLTLDDTQNFINRFMTWLSGQGRVNSPIAIFCDKLKEYANEGDSAILYVKTQDEIQMELEIARKTEKVRQEIELIERAKAFEKSKQEDLTFENWYLAASDEELLALKQPNSFMEFRSEIYKKTIKGIYLEQKLEVVLG
jgi:hypothetical protein